MRRIPASDDTTFADIRAACIDNDKRNHEAYVRLKEESHGRALYVSSSKAPLVNPRAIAKKLRDGAEFIRSAFQRQYSHLDLSRILTHMDEGDELEKGGQKPGLKVVDVYRMEFLADNETGRVKAVADLREAHLSKLPSDILKSAAKECSATLDRHPPNQVVTINDIKQYFDAGVRASLAKYAAEATFNPRVETVFDDVGSFKAMTRTHADIILSVQVIDRKKLGDMRPLLAFSCILNALEHIVPARKTAAFLDRLFFSARCLVADPAAFCEKAKALLPADPTLTTDSQTRSSPMQRTREKRIVLDSDEEADSEELKRQDEAKKTRDIAKQNEFARNMEKQLPFKSWAVEQISQLLLTSLDQLSVSDENQKRICLEIDGANQAIARAQSMESITTPRQGEAGQAAARMERVTAQDEAIDRKAQIVTKFFDAHLASRLARYGESRMKRRASAAAKIHGRRVARLSRTPASDQSESVAKPGDASKLKASPQKRELKAESQKSERSGAGFDVDWDDPSEPSRRAVAPMFASRFERPSGLQRRPTQDGGSTRDRRAIKRDRPLSSDLWQSGRIAEPAKPPPEHASETAPARAPMLTRNRLMIALDALTTPETTAEAKAWRSKIARTQEIMKGGTVKQDGVDS